MKISRLSIPDIMLIEPLAFGDDRGFFFESFNQRIFESAVGYPLSFVQDNHSKSIKNVLRGLHYQTSPKSQGKLIRVVKGSVLDVAVDLRQSSASFGRWLSMELSAENKRQLFVPTGFAHGFVVLSETCEFLYKTSEYYSPEHERCIAWNDPFLNIDWQLSSEPILSKKDQQGVLFKDADYFL